MSRLLKKQLFSILETLQEANQAIINLLDRKQIDDLAKLLTDCQEGAIAIGNQIELIYGEGKKSVQGLEAYCETLYHIVEKRNDSFALQIVGFNKRVYYSRVGIPPVGIADEHNAVIRHICY